MTDDKFEDWQEQCIQALETALRQEFDSESIKQDDIAEAARRRMYIKAIDWGYAHNVDIQPQLATQLANTAIDRYKSNWKNKVQGQDDRGHRFGKTSYL